MNEDEATSIRRDALRRAAELEIRWQNAIAQRQRASDLFSSSPKRERLPDEPDEGVR